MPATPAAVGRIRYRLAMLRRELVARVVRDLPARDVVAYPDHPMLLRGPDVLALTENGLTACFVSTKREPHTSRQFRANVLLSRFALPQGTGFVLVIDESDVTVDRGIDLVKHAVDPMEHGTDLFDALAVVNGRRRVEFGAHELRSESVAYVEELRGPHYERFSEAWALTHGISARRPRKAPGIPTAHLGLERGRRLGENRSFEFEDGRILTGRNIDAEGRTGLVNRVRRAVTIAAELDYGIDSGTAGLGEAAHLIESGDAHLAVHMNWERADLPRPRTVDPFKIERAAAFAGFATKGGEFAIA